MLLTLTLITIAVVVLALAGYLIAIAWELLRARRAVIAIADGLEAVARQTEPLAETLTAINGGLLLVLDELRAADRQLGRAAGALRAS